MNVRNLLRLYEKHSWTISQKKAQCRRYLEDPIISPLTFFSTDVRELAAVYAITSNAIDDSYIGIYFDAMINAWNFISVSSIVSYRNSPPPMQKITIMENVDTFLLWFKEKCGYEIRHSLTESLQKTIHTLMILRFMEVSKGEVFYIFMTAKEQSSSGEK